MIKLCPIFLKWTVWVSLDIHNHWAICRNQHLSSWFSHLHIPGCERTIFFPPGNSRTSKFYLNCSNKSNKTKQNENKNKKPNQKNPQNKKPNQIKTKKVILAREQISLPFVLWSSSKLFYSFPVLLVLLVCLQSLSGPQAHTIPAHVWCIKMYVSPEINFAMPYIWAPWSHILRCMSKI